MYPQITVRSVLFIVLKKIFQGDGAVRWICRQYLSGLTLARCFLCRDHFVKDLTDKAESVHLIVKLTRIKSKKFTAEVSKPVGTEGTIEPVKCHASDNRLCTLCLAFC